MFGETRRTSTLPHAYCATFSWVWYICFICLTLLLHDIILYFSPFSKSLLLKNHWTIFYPAQLEIGFTFLGKPFNRNNSLELLGKISSRFSKFRFHRAVWVPHDFSRKTEETAFLAQGNWSDYEQIFYEREISKKYKILNRCWHRRWDMGFAQDLKSKQENMAWLHIDIYSMAPSNNA